MPSSRPMPQNLSSTPSFRCPRSSATIYCEKASHKGIIIGKNGSMLKKISTEAREDCERFMGTKVFLQTWVKVKENWRDSQAMIRNFGYE